jgi:hypothetical protein
MPLDINPFIRAAVSQVIPSSLIGTVAGNIGALPGVLSADKAKAALDSTINRLSGGIGSALNGATGSITATNASSLQNLVQNNVSLQSTNLINNLTQVSSQAISQATQDIAQTIVSGGLSVDAVTTILESASSNIIQAARSANLPSVDVNDFLTDLADDFDWGSPETVVRPIPVEPGDWRVRISAPLGLGEIVFPVLPNMTLAHKANYTEIPLVHTNYLFLAYKNSQTDDITISCEWPVETLVDAAEWLDVVQLGRTLTKMFYGASSNLGNPPPICTIKGYSPGGKSIILPDTPVVVKSFSVDLKDDVNYIEAYDNYVPRLSSISITVSVIYNRNTQRGFSLQKYRDTNNVIKY